MTEHLSPVTLGALTDGELSREQLADAQTHLAECSSCTSQALAQSLLKAATKKAGLRYTPTGALESRMAVIVRKQSPSNRRATGSDYGNRTWLSLVGAATAVLLVVGIGGTAMWDRNHSEIATASANRAAQDRRCWTHIATLASNTCRSHHSNPAQH